MEAARRLRLLFKYNTMRKWTLPEEEFKILATHLLWGVKERKQLTCNHGTSHIFSNYLFTCFPPSDYGFLEIRNYVLFIFISLIYSPDYDTDQVSLNIVKWPTQQINKSGGGQSTYENKIVWGSFWIWLWNAEFKMTSKIMNSVNEYLRKE